MLASAKTWEIPTQVKVPRRAADLVAGQPFVCNAKRVSQGRCPRRSVVAL